MFLKDDVLTYNMSHIVLRYIIPVARNDPLPDSTRQNKR